MFFLKRSIEDYAGEGNKELSFFHPYSLFSQENIEENLFNIVGLFDVIWQLSSPKLAHIEVVCLFLECADDELLLF